MRLIFLRTGEWNDNAEIFYKLAVPPFEYVERSPKVQSARVRLSNIQINDSPAFSFVRRVFGLKKKKKPGSSYLFPNALDITKKKKKKEKEHRSTECFSILLTPIMINDYDKKL